MKLRFLFLFMVLATIVYGQRYQQALVQGPVHEKYLEKTIGIRGTETDSIVVEFRNTGRESVASIDTILGTDPLPRTGWVTEDKLFTGFVEIELNITNVDLATDSLLVSVYALDRDGNVRVNDVVYLLMVGVFPGYSTSAYYNGTWVTATIYIGSATGAFGMGTHGLLILVNPTDEGSTSGSGRLRVYLK